MKAAEMGVEEFAREFRTKMNKFHKDKVVRQDYKPNTKLAEYSYADITYMFNCAVFQIIYEKNNLKKGQYCISVETVLKNKIIKPRGRGGFSDLSIYFKRKNRILIEHENSYKSIDKHMGNTKLELNIKKLSEAVADYKLLITYYTDKPKSKNEKELLLTAVQKTVNKKNFSGELCLLCANFGSEEDKEWYPILYIFSKDSETPVEIPLT